MSQEHGNMWNLRISSVVVNVITMCVTCVLITSGSAQTGYTPGSKTIQGLPCVGNHKLTIEQFPIKMVNCIDNTNPVDDDDSRESGSLRDSESHDKHVLLLDLKKLDEDKLYASQYPIKMVRQLLQERTRFLRRIIFKDFQ